MLYHTFFFVRRLLYVLIMRMPFFPLKVILATILQFVWIGYLISCQPFEDQAMFWLELVNEFVLTIILVWLPAFRPNFVDNIRK